MHDWLKILILVEKITLFFQLLNVVAYFIAFYFLHLFLGRFCLFSN